MILLESKLHNLAGDWPYYCDHGHGRDCCCRLRLLAPSLVQYRQHEYTLGLLKRCTRRGAHKHLSQHTCGIHRIHRIQYYNHAIQYNTYNLSQYTQKATSAGAEKLRQKKKRYTRTSACAPLWCIYIYIYNIHVYIYTYIYIYIYIYVGALTRSALTHSNHTMSK